MEKEAQETIKKGMHLLTDVEALWFDLEKLSREGNEEERKLAKRLLETYFSDK